jgi:thiamine biosynthesis lipoprotein
MSKDKNSIIFEIPHRLEINKIFYYSGYDKVKHQLLIALSLLLLINWDCAKHSPEAVGTFNVISGFVQATTFSIKLYLPDDTKLTREELEVKIRNRLREIDYMMSVYNNDSEISRFNRSRKNGWFGVSPETAYVFDESLKISRLSDGAFDITIAPLVNLWGFGSSGTANSLPDMANIEKAKKITGYKNLEVRLYPPALSKKIPELYCTLSAVAQGYSVDDISLLLDKNGISSYMVEIGGEIKAKGMKPDRTPWRIGIAAPRKGQKKIQLAINLNNKAVSTSGDYQNYFEKNGKRYSHTIDPKTGYPITHGLTSVTVINGSCIYADAMATAIDVLGPVEGYNLAIKENLAVYMITHSGDKLETKMTPGFKALLDQK